VERASVTEGDECEGKESLEIEDIQFYVHVRVITYQTKNYLFLKVAPYGLLFRILQKIH